LKRPTLPGIANAKNVAIMFMQRKEEVMKNSVL
jgi:hypothetical protein